MSIERNFPKINTEFAAKRIGIGFRGEVLTKEKLKFLGYKVLHNPRNYCDLIVNKNILIEVKTGVCKPLKNGVKRWSVGKYTSYNAKSDFIVFVLLPLADEEPIFICRRSKKWNTLDGSSETFRLDKFRKHKQLEYFFPKIVKQKSREENPALILHKTGE